MIPEFCYRSHAGGKTEIKIIPAFVFDMISELCLMLITWEDKCYRSPGGTEELRGVDPFVSSVTPKFISGVK